MPAEPARELGVLLTPAEVAQVFGVNPKTVSRWARSGLLTRVRTQGGRRRYRQVEVEQMLESGTDERSGGNPPWSR